MISLIKVAPALIDPSPIPFSRAEESLYRMVS